MNKMTFWPETAPVVVAEASVEVAVVGGNRLLGSDDGMTKSDDENRSIEVGFGIASEDSGLEENVNGGKDVERLVKYGGRIPRVVGRLAAVGNSFPVIATSTGARYVER